MAETARFDASVLRDCVPTTKAIRYLAEMFPFLDPVYHLLVSSRSEKRSSSLAKTHVSTYPFEEGSFIRVASGLYVPSPELCFVQVSCQELLLEAIREGHAFCGTFALDESSDTGLRERMPLATVDSIGHYARTHSRLPGSAKALRALSKVKEGSASPRESDLAMRLTLPNNLGGFGLDGASLNCRIKPSKRAAGYSDREYYIGDLCWLDEKVVVEYDSNLHLTPVQLARDAQKRAALEEDGFRVVTVTKLQLDSTMEMERVAKRVARCLGRRLRIQIPDFAKRQEKLFGIGSRQERFAR